MGWGRKYPVGGQQVGTCFPRYTCLFSDGSPHMTITGKRGKNVGKTEEKRNQDELSQNGRCKIGMANSYLDTLW